MSFVTEENHCLLRGMGGEFGGEWIRVYVWLSPFTVYLNLTRLLNGCTPIQHSFKTFKKRRRKKPLPVA